MGNLISNYFTCDGCNVGFKIRLKGNENYLKTRNGADRLFTNVEFAQAIARINGANSLLDFDIDLYIGGSIISFDYIQRVGNNLEFFGNDENGVVNRYVIEETKTREYSDFGYICFDNGENERIDKKIGIKRAKRLRQIIMESAEKINFETCMVSDIIEYDKGICFKFWNTTATLDIVTNSCLMDINQWRKNIESEDKSYSRCFPYIKTMDKFVTFYTFASKELYEPSKAPRSKAMSPKQFKELLIKDLVDNWSTYSDKEHLPVFKPVFYKTNNNKILSN